MLKLRPEEHFVYPGNIFCVTAKQFCMPGEQLYTQGVDLRGWKAIMCTLRAFVYPVTFLCAREQSCVPGKLFCVLNAQQPGGQQGSSSVCPKHTSPCPGSSAVRMGRGSSSVCSRNGFVSREQFCVSMKSSVCGAVACVPGA